MTKTATAAEASAALGVSIRTVHRMVESGQLTPIIKLPGKTGAYLFDPEQVELLKAERAAA